MRSNDEGWYQPDLTAEGYFERMRSLERLLEGAGKFDARAISAALRSTNPQTKKGVASWLRDELKQMRAVQSKGGHPVRRGKTLSLPEIADLAFTMLETLHAVDVQLLSLLRELLNVDRHRRAFANRKKFNRAADSEAQFRLQGSPQSVNKMASSTSISVSTASEWKKLAKFQERVSSYEQFWRHRVGDYVQIVKDRYPEIGDGHAFRIAMLVHSFLLYSLFQGHWMGEEMATELKRIVAALRSNFERPPISRQFLPSEKFEPTSPEDVLRQGALVIPAITELIGDPKGKIRVF
jgi:hypothetical protein